MKVIGFGVIGLLVGGLVASGILWLIFLTGGAEYTLALAWALVYGIIPGAVVGLIIGLFVGLGIGGSNRKFVYPKGVLCNKCGTAIGKGATTCAVCGADMNDLTDI